MEDCALFFDGPSFGSSVRFLYSFLSLSGDSFYPPNSQFVFTMVDATGLYRGKNFEVHLLTGQYNRTVTLVPITSASTSSSNSVTADAALAIGILSFFLSVIFAFVLSFKFKSHNHSHPMSTQQEMPNKN